MSVAKKEMCTHFVVERVVWERCQDVASKWRQWSKWLSGRQSSSAIGANNIFTILMSKFDGKLLHLNTHLRVGGRVACVQVGCPNGSNSKKR